ncbi:DUF6481 family protein [Paracraurococcus sp. LOR1-02]|uniref:DUF6481 family protein n=1 Tax=Paracraurococcus lichenis TaxID=3064888 RepID=A0ABT9E2A6_9PROT|nr:DUF6481 family protein [Paracraurococcus sp. LOR1-02]MDO9710290.1 DUF6481 family protein [Paracraurococcus sp. LOR1-02]
MAAATCAGQAILEKIRARPAAYDPALLPRQAELKAIAEAREVRIAERTAARAAEAARLEAEQKAARDARCAARKARSKR